MTAEKVQILPLRKTSPSSSDGTTPSHSSEDGNKPAKRKRTSTPKTRTGCTTCKIRRVKCDEAKPACNRCTSTGRKCDGYAIKPRKKRTRPGPREKTKKVVAVVSVKPSSGLELYTDITPAEFRSLHYYHAKTAPALSSYFDSDFWLRMVFQMSHVEPSVMHAMVALGALHEQREMGLRRVPETPVVVKAISDMDGTLLEHHDGLNDEFALIQYGKAITHLSNRMNSESSIEVALLACVLFVCVEFLRGDPQQAINHFKSGMNIAMSSFGRNQATTSKADTVHQVRDMVWSFLSRIELLSIIDGNELGWNYPVELLEAVPDKFENIKEARDSFIHLANLTLRFITRMKALKYSGPILPDELVRQEALIRQLDVWAETLDKILLTGTLTELEMDAVKTLKMHQVIGSMWLRRCTFPEESASDGSMREYEIAVSLAESIHSTNNNSNDSTSKDHPESTIIFDMQMITPLFYIASSCRHPQIRRRAIAVLKRTQRQEGLWDSARAVAAAERILHYEEKNLTTLDGSELPAEKDRIHGTHMDSELGTNPKVHVLTFRSLPEGLKGPWKTWREQITLP